MESPEDALTQVAILKTLLKESEVEMRDVQTELVKHMQDGDIEKVRNADWIGSLVEPTRISYNEVRLKKELTDKQWDLITRKVVDKALVEHAVALGVLDIKTLAKCSVETAVTPYILIKEA